MKYNKSEIMKSAWARYKMAQKWTNAADWTFSRCLKATWADAKKAIRETVEPKGEKIMRGTEKQMPWALEIQTRVLSILDATTAYIKSQPATPAGNANLEGIAARRKLIANAEYAGDIISLFRWVEQTGDISKDFRSVLRVYKTTSPETEGQRKILMK